MINGTASKLLATTYPRARRSLCLLSIGKITTASPTNAPAPIRSKSAPTTITTFLSDFILSLGSIVDSDADLFGYSQKDDRRLVSRYTEMGVNLMPIWVTPVYVEMTTTLTRAKTDDRLTPTRDTCLGTFGLFPNTALLVQNPQYPGANRPKMII